MTSRAQTRKRNTVLSVLGATVITALTAVALIVVSRTPKPQSRLTVLAVQPQPGALGAARADVDAQLAAINGGDVIVLAMDSTPPATAYEGSLDCPSDLDATTCQEVKIQKRAQIAAVAANVLSRPAPKSVDVLGLLRVTHDQVELKTFHAVDMYLDAAGPINAGSLDATTASTTSTALVDKVSTTPEWVTSCPDWHLNVADATLDPAASASDQAFIGGLMVRCGGQLAAWVGRWPSFNGAIPLPPSTNISSVDNGNNAIIILDDRGSVTFISGSADLTPQAQQTVDQLGQTIAASDPKKVTVQGYTDNTGSPGYNLDLARRRAQTVADRLITNGVAHSAIVVESYGQTYPVASNSDEMGRGQNRRVDIVVERS